MTEEEETPTPWPINRWIWLEFSTVVGLIPMNVINFLSVTFEELCIIYASG